MLEVKEKITVFFDGVKEKVFDKMIDALEYVHNNGYGKKVRFETSKEFNYAK